MKIQCTCTCLLSLNVCDMYGYMCVCVLVGRYISMYIILLYHFLFNAHLNFLMFANLMT